MTGIEEDYFYGLKLAFVTNGIKEDKVHGSD